MTTENEALNKFVSGYGFAFNNTEMELVKEAWQASKTESEKEIADSNEREAYESSLASSRAITIAELTAQNAKLREAGQAVVDRWHTPNWKDVEHTGVFIHRLEEALASTQPQSDICF